MSLADHRAKRIERAHIAGTPIAARVVGAEQNLAVVEDDQNGRECAQVIDAGDVADIRTAHMVASLTTARPLSSTRIDLTLTLPAGAVVLERFFREETGLPVVQAERISACPVCASRRGRL